MRVKWLARGTGLCQSHLEKRFLARQHPCWLLSDAVLCRQDDGVPDFDKALKRQEGPVGGFRWLRQGAEVVVSGRFDGRLIP